MINANALCFAAALRAIRLVSGDKHLRVGACMRVNVFHQELIFFQQRLENFSEHAESRPNLLLVLFADGEFHLFIVTVLDA